MARPDLPLTATLAALALLMTASPVRAQDGEAFVAPFNDKGSPAVPADKRIAADAPGLLQPFRGRPWWHALAFCSGVYENQAFTAEQKGDAARAATLREESDRRFFRPALLRVMADRGIDIEPANDVLSPDMNYQFLAAGISPQPFESDVARCRAIETRYAALDRPAAPSAVAPPPAPASLPAERRFKATSSLTQNYDGQVYWQLMMRCAKGSQGIAGPRGELMGRFARAAIGLLAKDRGVGMAEAQKQVMAATPALEPIAPGPSEDRDPCIAMGKQLGSEASN
ncbi:MAG: hypothetical protein ABIS51_03740 [Sphingomonas sp.]